MGVRVALLLFLMLLHSHSGFIGAQEVYKFTEGDVARVRCKLRSFGPKIIFCKNNCSKENILVQTSEKGACNGRFCIEHRGWFKSYVSITSVTSADSGQYQCAMDDGRMTVTFTLEVTKTKIIYPGHTLGPQLKTFSVESSRPHELNTTNSSEPKFLLLLILVPAVLIIASVVVIYKRRKLQHEYGNKRHSEVAVYENCPAPASEPADSTYQSLCADTRDHNHIYSSLNPQPHLTEGTQQQHRPLLLKDSACTK
ncbi:hypothetical protein NQD34_004848 [Periophthalmus magnuspinnatus]|nr:hypothetical protein NQD34_004848 [Periophthalmus magnuspinnatus]